ncbi:hypothetical protein [Brevibacillus panacihumi]|uniref:hypothetical protein n=1 Tax=Brevibacillus panacihumi TaxID=497735 RepID=UPI003D2028C0
MFKKALTLAVVGSALFATSAYAAISSYSSYISLDNHTSSSYSVPYRASTTASATSYMVHTRGNVYFNNAWKADGEEVGTKTASFSKKTSGKSGTNGRWDIEAYHYQWASADNLVDVKESDDTVYYDKNDWLLAKSEAKQELTKKIDSELKDFEVQTVKNIANDLDLDLTDYEQISVGDAIELDKTFSLFKEIEKVLSNQQEGDIRPTVYLHSSNEEVLVLQKKANGTSIVYQIEKKNEEWSTVDKNSKKGNKLSVPMID